MFINKMNYMNMMNNNFNNMNNMQMNMIYNNPYNNGYNNMFNNNNGYNNMVNNNVYNNNGYNNMVNNNVFNNNGYNNINNNGFNNNGYNNFGYHRSFSNNVTNQNYLSNNNINIPTSQSTGNIFTNNNPNPSPIINNDDDELKEIIPRPDVFQPNEDNTDFSQDVPIKNLVVEASTGLKLMIKAPVNTTIKDFLKMYVKKIGLNESIIDKGIVFLFAGKRMDSQSMQTIQSFQEFAIITAFDQNNVIGASID